MTPAVIFAVPTVPIMSLPPTIIFSATTDEVSQLVTRNALKILMGTGVFDKKIASDFIETESYKKLICSSLNVINDMDNVADILFERTT